MTEQDPTESIEHTLAELEAQQLTAQQLLDEALSELEVLYAELQDQAEALANVAIGSDETSDSEPPSDSAAVSQLKAELEQATQDRDRLESQLFQLQQQVEQMAASSQAAREADDESLEPATSDTCNSSLVSLTVPNASAMRSPFDELRALLAERQTSSVQE